MTSPAVAEPKAAQLERRSLPVWSALSLVLPLVAVIAVAAANGGFFATAFGWTALAFAWVTIVAAVLVVPRWGVFDGVWTPAAAALCVFTFCSALWAGSAGTAINQGQRALVYATAVAGALLLLRRRDLERWLFGLVLGAAAICFYSLATRLFADHFGAFNADAGYRLFVPVGYWNALGIFAASRCAARVRRRGRRTKPGATSSRRRTRRLAADALLHLQPRLVGRAPGRARRRDPLSPWRERLFVGLFVFGPLPALAVWLASRPDALTSRSPRSRRRRMPGTGSPLELALLALVQAAVADCLRPVRRPIAVPHLVRSGVAWRWR